MSALCVAIDEKNGTEEEQDKKEGIIVYIFFMLLTWNDCFKMRRMALRRSKIRKKV
jgi:hypothetical protein